LVGSCTALPWQPGAARPSFSLAHGETKNDICHGLAGSARPRVALGSATGARTTDERSEFDATGH
jgi:hypothetical protein